MAGGVDAALKNGFGMSYYEFAGTSEALMALMQKKVARKFDTNSAVNSMKEKPLFYLGPLSDYEVSFEKNQRQIISNYEYPETASSFQTVETAKTWADLAKSLAHFSNEPITVVFKKPVLSYLGGSTAEHCTGLNHLPVDSFEFFPGRGEPESFIEKASFFIENAMDYGRKVKRAAKLLTPVPASKAPNRPK